VGRAAHLDAAAVLPLSRPHCAEPRLRFARARRPRLALIGVINLPIIKFSVDWWNTLHQPASITRLDAPAIHNSILVPLLWMAVSLLFLFVWLVLLRTETEIDRRRLENAEAAA
jgi:lysylphosphatidylglycerol synthetase-like protein (DUF2156 family)